jgi:hypothetical protein
MNAQIFAVVCAWCQRTVTPAPSGAAVTHTICASCVDWMFTDPNLQISDNGKADSRHRRPTIVSH